ncbi:CsxC family protein [Clostridium intestinale]|jgi:hypothetical protein|uniref:DUF7852 domain-containing protein n=2 Tax=Clostridium intestinale TaxID=36845 RepID=U2NTI2_9CLOT|nr:hypothetical protein [Clostridium intestinale]ERK32166.1 hypothetical protein CINTURNW_0374 [Clostridium intestinale URNW]QLY79274.1 hypothetical protein HZF06_19725 [Clostridium intestinale]
MSKKYCSSKIYSEEVNLSSSTNASINPRCRVTYTRLPVLLSVRDVQIDLQSCIELCDDLYEIKRVKKEVYITQCKLMVNCGKVDPVNPDKGYGKLFLTGYIEKNIEYAVAGKPGCNGQIMVGAIKHATVKVPFSTATEIDYIQKPVIECRENGKEINYFTKCNKSIDCSCGGFEMGNSKCEWDFADKIIYIEKPFCRLAEARIFDADQAIDSEDVGGKDYDYDKYNEFAEYDEFEEYGKEKCKKHGKDDKCENVCQAQEFKFKKHHKIVERMVAYLKIELYQEQLVYLDK